MRPVSHQMLASLPALIAFALLLLSATPISGGDLTYTPNIAWLMTLVMVTFYPGAWPRGLAFGFGLLQDVLYGTPLGSQALLTLIVAQVTEFQSYRNQVQLFRLRWLEAAGTLIALHLMLWAIMHLVAADSASLRHLVRAGLMNALWYPIFYGVVTRCFAALPDAK